MSGPSTTDFQADLKARFDGLSPQLQQAARWVLDHPADVALLSLREQARRSGLTPATLTRLAQRLDLAGYDDVRRLHAEAMRRGPESFRGRAEDLLARHRRGGEQQLARDVIAAQTRHLEALGAPEAMERLSAAAETIAAADHVFCLGQRSSFAVAFIFHYVRSLFGSKSALVDGPGATARDVLRGIGPADVMVAITVDPYVRDTVETARYAKQRGARIVAITDSDLSPLAAIADRTVVIRTETPSFFHTMTPAFAAVECLAALVAARRGEETLSALAASERQLTTFDTYLARRKEKRVRS